LKKIKYSNFELSNYLQLPRKKDLNIKKLQDTIRKKVPELKKEVFVKNKKNSLYNF